MPTRYLLPALALLLALPAQAQNPVDQPAFELEVVGTPALATVINNSTTDYPAAYTVPAEYPATSNIIGRSQFYFVVEGDTTGTGVVLTDAISADFVLAEDGKGQPALGCTDDQPDPTSDIENDISGKIVFISRGLCSFVYKVENAQNAGAVAVVIYNDPPRNPDIVTNLGSVAGFMRETSIPAAWLPYSMAQGIVDALASGTSLSGTLRPEPVGNAVDDTPAAAAAAFGVATPNPFSQSTSFTVTLPEAEAITVEVYDVQGRRVATLQDGLLAAGETTVRFDADTLPSGVYLVRATGEAFSLTRTVSVVR